MAKRLQVTCKRLKDQLKRDACPAFPPVGRDFFSILKVWRFDVGLVPLRVTLTDSLARFAPVYLTISHRAMKK